MLNRKIHQITSPLSQSTYNCSLKNYLNTNFQGKCFCLKELVVMLKSCARGVVRLQPMFSFLLLVILFGLQSSDLCPFIKIIMVSKT